MKGNIILNILLLTALVFLLAIPTAINLGFLQKPDTTEKVAGLQTLAHQGFLIQPNLRDFGELASFDKPQGTTKTILEKVNLTLLPNQIATYHHLFLITNDSSQAMPLTITVKNKEALESNIKIEGFVENGEKYPLFPLNQPFNLTLKGSSHAYLTIMLSSKTNDVASKQVSLDVVFFEPTQN